MRHIRRRFFVDDAGVHQRLVALGKRTHGRDQIAVHQRTVGTGALGERKAEPQDQFLSLI